MIKNIQTMLFLYCILIVPVFSVYPLLQNNFTTSLVDQNNDSVIVVSKMRYCRTDSYAIADFTSSVQDVTATSKPSRVPIPPEPSQNNESMVSEKNQNGSGFKKIGKINRSEYQYTHSSLADSRHHTTFLSFLTLIPHHLKSTVLLV